MRIKTITALALAGFFIAPAMAQQWLGKLPDRPKDTSSSIVLPRVYTTTNDATTTAGQSTGGYLTQQTITVKVNPTGDNVQIGTPARSDPAIVLMSNPATVVNCQETSETSSDSTVTGKTCASPATGTITARRDFVCGANGTPGAWGAWYELSSSCCDPTAFENRSLSCNTGYTGGPITQKRMRLCPSNTWGAWATTSDACVAGCTPGSESMWGQCPAGYSGYTTLSRSWTCSGSTPVYGAWAQTGSTCTLNCSAETETRQVACSSLGSWGVAPIPDFAGGGSLVMVEGTAVQQRSRACSNLAWSDWSVLSTAGCYKPCPACNSELIGTNISRADYDKTAYIAGLWNNQNLGSCGIAFDENYNGGAVLSPTAACNATNAFNATESYQVCSTQNNISGCSDAFTPALAAGTTGSAVSYTAGSGKISLQVNYPSGCAPSGVDAACASPSNPQPVATSTNGEYTYTAQCPGAAASRSYNVAPGSNCNWQSSGLSISTDQVCGTASCLGSATTRTDYAVAPASGCNFVSGTMTISGGTTLNGSYTCPSTVVTNNVGYAVSPGSGCNFTSGTLSISAGTTLSGNYTCSSSSGTSYAVAPGSGCNFTSGTLSISGGTTLNGSYTCSSSSSVSNYAVAPASTCNFLAGTLSFAGTTLSGKYTCTATGATQYTGSWGLAAAIGAGCTASSPTPGTANGNGNLNFTKTCTASGSGSTNLVPAAMAAGCTASSPTPGTANGNGNVNFTKTCTTSGSGSTNLVPAAMAAGCTASSPTPGTANGNGNILFTKSCPGTTTSSGSMSMAADIGAGCTAANPRPGTANGNGNVTYDKTCTTTGSLCMSLAGDLTGGCTASGPVSPIVNNNGGVTYQRTCPVSTSKTVALAPGSGCTFNAGMSFSGANVCGSYHCAETRNITSGGTTLPASMTGSDLYIQGGNQVCGTWSGVYACSTQTAYQQCIHSPYTCPHGGDPATCWSGVSAATNADCGTCGTTDYLYNLRISRTCSGSCLPETQACDGYQCGASYPAPVTEMCPPGRRADPNGKQSFWRYKGCNPDGTSYFMSWDIGTDTCKSSSTADAGQSCVASTAFSGPSVIGTISFGVDSSLPCFMGSTSVAGVTVAYTMGAAYDQIAVAAGTSYGAIYDSMLTPASSQSLTIGGGCVMRLEAVPGLGWDGQSGAGIFYYYLFVSHPASGTEEFKKLRIDASAIAGGGLSVCMINQ